MIDENTIDVKYIQQADPKTCWNAAYKMMLNYKGRGRLGIKSGQFAE